MTINDLQQKLKEAYTLINLNKISLTLINLYKEEQFATLQKIADIIDDFFVIEIGENGKGFSKLIKLYHPDRLSHYLGEIENLYQQNNFDGLLELSHILKLERIEEISVALQSYDDIDYSPVYEWDINEKGFHIVNEKKAKQKTNTKINNYSFYDAIKIRQYGNTEIDFPSYYLEDIEEFELASSGINDLDGIQYCVHAKTIDLSENHISELSLLETLGLIEELNLSDNIIEDIDMLAYLTNLKSLYLANNKIKNIEPLFELNQLEYVDLTGNKISQSQITVLTQKGVTVDY